MALVQLSLIRLVSFLCLAYGPIPFHDYIETLPHIPDKSTKTRLLKTSLTGFDPNPFGLNFRNSYSRWQSKSRPRSSWTQAVVALEFFGPMPGVFAQKRLLLVVTNGAYVQFCGKNLFETKRLSGLLGRSTAWNLWFEGFGLKVSLRFQEHAPDCDRNPCLN